MFVRVTTFKMKTDRISEAEAKINEMLPQIMAMPGVQSFTNAIDDDGNGIVVSVNESEEKSNANLEQVGKIWAVFSDDLLEPPSASGYRVISHQNN